jgi:hypothetical protein
MVKSHMKEDEEMEGYEESKTGTLILLLLRPR